MSVPEIWKDIQGFEGFYQVSNLGRVRSLQRTTSHGRGLQSRILKGDQRMEGHLQVVLYRDGRRKTRYIHHLVLEAFVGTRPAGTECCHNDGQPSNNRVSNLRWDTRSNNLLDAYKHHARQPGGGRPKRRVLRSDGVQFESIQQAARVTGCSHGHIVQNCQGLRPQAGGFTWQYQCGE